MTRAMGTDAFLGHRTQAPRGAMLTKWTERPPVRPASTPPMPGVNTVLFRRDYAYVLWRHNIPRIHVRDDGSKEVWSGQHVCWEEEDVLQNQFRRYDDDRRRRPPQRCGICKMLEWIYQQISEEKLSWVAPLFRFDDGNETTILRAGGVTNLFGRDLSDGEKAQLKKHGIFPSQSWKQSMMAKAQYLFCLVDYDDPGSGGQIAIVSQLLGSRVQKVIADRQASRGTDEGDPSKHPFVIQWLYNPGKSVQFNEKYDARAIESLKITPEIDKIISDDPPEVDHLVKRFNALEVRAALEDAAEVELPWDEFFGKLDDGQQKREDAPDIRSGSTAAEGDEALNNRLFNEGDRPSGTGESLEPAFDCDTCGKPVADSDKKCPHCGAVFEAEEPPPPPPPRQRRTAIAPPAQQPKAATTAAQDADELALPDDSQDIPF